MGFILNYKITLRDAAAHLHGYVETELRNERRK